MAGALPCTSRVSPSREAGSWLPAVGLFRARAFSALGIGCAQGIGKSPMNHGAEAALSAPASSRGSLSPARDLTLAAGVFSAFTRKERGFLDDPVQGDSILLRPCSQQVLLASLLYPWLGSLCCAPLSILSPLLSGHHLSRLLNHLSSGPAAPRTALPSCCAGQEGPQAPSSGRGQESHSKMLGKRREDGTEAPATPRGGGAPGLEAQDRGTQLGALC